MKKHLLILAALWAWLFTASASADPVGTAFTYQGRLTDGGNAANGTHEFEFYLYDAATNGNMLGTQTKEEVPVTDGIFTVQLDFGPAAFNGQPRWLEIWVRNDTDGQPGETLSPRQEITPTPYAMMAAKVPANSITSTELANGAVTSGKIANGAVTSGTIAAGAVTGSNIANGAITNANVALGAIQSQNLAAGSVGATQLATGAVTGDKLGANAAYQNLLQNNQSPVGSSGVIMSQLAAAPELLAAGYLQAGQATLVQEAWDAKMHPPDGPLAFNLPDQSNTAVWSGSEMLVWGGNSSFNGIISNVGGRYNPAAKTWTPMSTVNAPSPRMNHTSIWTGTEMIVWGGFDGAYLNTGARYNPATNTWNTISTSGAPTGRRYHTAVWTGTHMIIWGGNTSGDERDANGAIYNPATNTWSVMSNSGAEARSKHVAFWSAADARMHVIAGAQNTVKVDRYNPSNNTWSSITISVNFGISQLVDAISTGTEILAIQATPQSRLLRYNFATGIVNEFYYAIDSGSSIVWDGTRALIWGYGFTVDDPSGGIFYPATNTFGPISQTRAPLNRSGHVAVWTGTRMLVWGGQSGLSGGSYDPIADSWEPIPGLSAGGRRSRGFSQIWTGSDMIIWGGVDQSDVTVQGGLRYNLAANSWTILTDTNAPSARVNHSAVWTGTEMIVWGGGTADGEEFFYDGARYNPSTNTWTELPTLGAPTIESHRAIWTGSQMIVVGSGSGSMQGARYNPATNTWTALPIANAPASRQEFALVWSGTEMILWGGINGTTGNVTGARYNLATNTWTPITTTNAHPGRANPAAAWTGSEMVIFGGGSAFGPYPTQNARYNPTTNTWTNLGTTNALSARRDMAFGWDGSQIFTWSGNAENGSYFFNTSAGRLYTPGDNSWSTISHTSAPTPRAGTKAVWTGTAFLLFGGEDANGAVTQTTYSYVPKRTYFFYVRP